METFLIIHIILFRAKIEPLQIKKSENPLKMWILGFSSVIQTLDSLVTFACNHKIFSAKLHCLILLLFYVHLLQNKSNVIIMSLF